MTRTEHDDDTSGITMTDIQISNAESDAQLKTRAMQYILNRICRKYLEKDYPTFNQ